MMGCERISNPTALASIIVWPIARASITPFWLITATEWFAMLNSIVDSGCGPPVASTCQQSTTNAMTEEKVQSKVPYLTQHCLQESDLWQEVLYNLEVPADWQELMAIHCPPCLWTTGPAVQPADIPLTFTIHPWYYADSKCKLN